MCRQERKRGAMVTGQKSKTRDKKIDSQRRGTVEQKGRVTGIEGANTFNRRELKLTAAIYASRPGVVKHLQKTGKLPKRINTGGAQIQIRVIIERRGTNLRLTSDEKLVYEAILRERRLPGGGAILVHEHH